MEGKRKSSRGTHGYWSISHQKGEWTMKLHFIIFSGFLFLVLPGVADAALAISMNPVEGVVSVGEVATYEIVAIIPFTAKLFYWGGDLVFGRPSGSNQIQGQVSLVGTTMNPYWEANPGTDADGLCGSNRAGITGTVVLFSFDVKGVTEGFLTVSFTQTPGDSYEIFGTSPSEVALVRQGTIQVVPEPATLAMMLFGGLIMSRRRLA